MTKPKMTATKTTKTNMKHGDDKDEDKYDKDVGDAALAIGDQETIPANEQDQAVNNRVFIVRLRARKSKARDRLSPTGSKAKIAPVEESAPRDIGCQGKGATMMECEEIQSGSGGVSGGGVERCSSTDQPAIVVHLTEVEVGLEQVWVDGAQLEGTIGEVIIDST